MEERYLAETDAESVIGGGLASGLVFGERGIQGNILMSGVGMLEQM